MVWTAAESARSASTTSSLHVRQAQHRAIGLEALAQGLAQTAGSAGQQQLFVNFDGHFWGPGPVSSPVIAGTDKHWTFFWSLLKSTYKRISHRLSDDSEFSVSPPSLSMVF
jgi:hypothetical protein